MWSDPEDIDTWAVSPRGAGWLFGRTVTREVRPSIPKSNVTLTFLSSIMLTL